MLALRVPAIPEEVEENLRLTPVAVSFIPPENAETAHIHVVVRDKKVSLSYGKEQSIHPKEVFAW